MIQDPQTLRWLALANELGSGDEQRFPSFLSNKKDVYKKAYPKLVAWLKGLSDNDAMSFLSKWKLSWSEGQYVEIWQDSKRTFAHIHRQTADKERELVKEAADFLTQEKVDQAKMFVSDLEKITNWIQKVPRMNSKALMAWTKNAGPDSRLGQIWYQNYKDEYQWANYHKAKMFFAASTYELASQDSELRQLIRAAQDWARFLEKKKPSFAKPLAQGSGK